MRIDIVGSIHWGVPHTDDDVMAYGAAVVAAVQKLYPGASVGYLEKMVGGTQVAVRGSEDQTDIRERVKIICQEVFEAGEFWPKDHGLPPVDLGGSPPVGLPPMSDLALARLLRKEQAAVEEGREPEAVRASARLCWVGLKSGMHVGLERRDIQDRRKRMEWVGGQLIEIVDRKNWLALKSWLGMVDDYVPVVFHLMDALWQVSDTSVEEFAEFDAGVLNRLLVNVEKALHHKDLNPTKRRVDKLLEEITPEFLTQQKLDLLRAIYFDGERMETKNLKETLQIELMTHETDKLSDAEFIALLHKLQDMLKDRVKR